MPIEFLGDQAKKLPKAKTTDRPSMHKPEKDLLAAAKKKKQALKQAEVIGPQYINLADRFKYYFLKRRLTFIVLFAIIIAAGSYVYINYFYQPKPPVVIVVNNNAPVISIPTPAPTPVVSPTPTPPVGPLPDTELAPLRGSVVKFQGETDLYLIEDNGELRHIDKQSVVFDNGQNINQISFRLIYTIADRYKNIRQGKEVIGLVDWDPRVLSYQELAPFLE